VMVISDEASKGLQSNSQRWIRLFLAPDQSSIRAYIRVDTQATYTKGVCRVSVFINSSQIPANIAFSYSLRPVILFASINVFRYILVVDTSILAKSNMGRRKYSLSEGNCRVSQRMISLTPSTDGDTINSFSQSTGSFHSYDRKI
jgi:hypothetical protein